MSRRIFIGILGIIISLTLSHTCFADPLWYGNIVSISDDTATLEFRGLEQKYYLSCTISTRECSEVSLPQTTSHTANPPSSQKNHFRFPNLSNHRNGSSDNIFKFYTTLSSKKTTLSLVNTTTKKTYSLSDPINFWNLLDMQPRISKFSPDNTQLAYVNDRSGFTSLYITNLTTLSKKGLSGVKITSDVSVGDFTFADSHTLLYVANTTSDPYDWVLYSYSTDTQTTRPLAHHLTYDSILHQSGNSIVFTTLGQLGTVPVILSDYRGTDIENFILPIETPSSKNPLSYTYQNIAGFDTVVMSNRSLPETTKHPLIVWLHGGPYRQSSFIRHTYISYGVYDWDLEQAVNQGAYVVKIDYPGSYGSGRKNTESIKFGVGLIDVKAVKSVIDDFTAHNTVDGVYLVGNSYGGYLALRTAVEYPDQITGTLSINGVTDWQSLLIYYKNSIFNEFFGGLPNSHNKKLFAQASLFSRVTNLKNPVTIIQGEVDSTIPKFQATALKSALDHANKQSTLVLIPDENHVFEKDSSINTICATLFHMIGLSDTSSCNLQN